MRAFRDVWCQQGGAVRLLLAAFALTCLGFGIGRFSAPPPAPKGDGGTGAEQKTETTWTCSMHPQIRQPEPGKCPICRMDLIPASQDDDGGATNPRMLRMSEAAMKLAEVATTPVEKRFVDIEIPMVGRIEYDESRVKTIAAWVPGRLDRLFVDYTGIPVKKGDHLVTIYSPELYAAQEELLQAKQAAQKLGKSASEFVRGSTVRTVEASREKLRLLGLSPQQVEAVEARAKASATMQINAPASGIVIHKNAEEGMYVKTGTPIYKVADLSRVWIKLDAYESDLAWLRYGQEVSIKTEAYGDQAFHGWISFIDPVLNPETRTVKVRVVVDNERGLLRPNMFARATVKATVGAGGQVATRNLDGKWISPMHPEVVADEPGECDVCGMALVRAADLGYISEAEDEPALVVPASAVLTTGERAIVYVRVPDTERPTFQGLEVDLGPRAGEDYIVRSGLVEGQLVVTNGNFKIDSALQLQAKPSMMNPQGGGPAPAGHAHHAPAKTQNAAAPPRQAAHVLEVPPPFLAHLQPVYEQYLAAQEALAGDAEATARRALDALALATREVDPALLKGRAHMQWMEIRRQFTAALEHRAHAQGMAGLRTLFVQVSQAAIRLETTFGHAGTKAHRVAFCPMANDNEGAEWLQRGEAVSNPYYGAAMLRCGEIRQTVPARAGTPAAGRGGSHESHD